MLEVILGVASWLDGLSAPGRLIAWLLMVAIVSGILYAATAFLLRYGPVLRPTLSTMLVLIAGTAALLSTYQGTELAKGLTDDGWRMPVLFVLTVSFWAWQSWFWSRAALSLRFGPDRKAWDLPRWRTWLPRVYALTVYAVAVAFVGQGIAGAGDRAPRLVAVWALLVLCAAAFLLGAIIRKSPWKRAQWFPRPEPQVGSLEYRLEVYSGPHGWREIAHRYPLANLNILVTVVVLVGLVLWAGWHPVELGRIFGSATLVLMALGIWVSLLTALHLMASPYRISLLLMVVAVSAVGNTVRSHHQIRTIDGPFEIVPRKFEDAAREWATQIGATKDGKPITVVFVAAAGGGIRAAYWTAYALSTLNIEYPQLFDHIFAVSAVSGGSLGATVTLAAVREQRRGKLTAHEARAEVLEALDRDHLAPVVAAGMFSDVLAGALPNVLGLESRGTALENSWARSLSISGEFPLDKPFLRLWAPFKDASWLPILLLNATHEESGKRIIVSNLRVDDWPFSDAMDLHNALGRDMRASTAVHNSARFSWISPAGVILDPSGRRQGHVIDGGYFENYGAITMLEVIEAFRIILDGIPFHPVILQISSDPGLSFADMAGIGERECPPRTPKPTLWDLPDTSAWTLINEFWAPLGGLYVTRESRGVSASKKLAYWACTARSDEDMNSPEFVHLRLCHSFAPLGWALAAQTRKEIKDGFDRAGCNALDLTRLEEALWSLQVPR